MITKILGQSSFWMVNKAIAKHLNNNDAALLLSELIDKYDYFKTKNELIDNRFYYTSEMMFNNLNISYHQQKNCIKILVRAGFIETKLMGIPAKLHFKIIENKILSFLNTGIEEIQKQDVKKFETNNTKSNNTKEKNTKNNYITYISEIEKESILMLERFNHFFPESKFTNHLSFLKNYEKWRQIYQPAQIEEAIYKSSLDPFWKDKMTPQIFFRLKNPNKEDVDNIDKFLNLKIEKNHNAKLDDAGAEVMRRFIERNKKKFENEKV